MTSNLCHHAKIYWGEEAVAAADAAKLHNVACEVVEKSLGMPDGSITATVDVPLFVGESVVVRHRHVL